MRVQHNIMAMGAYRNYTNNVSAMKKNLERLSSGYKINRAGDDAAGLAISEKMRAQITGLETAQKNAKDGISLVQTAEGALQEVHDMLNRMVELATQSANGTYDNSTDRFQLQKEMDQLKTEIDRIADSANFNGIQLLDGSMAKVEAAAAYTDSELTSVSGIDRILKSVLGDGDTVWGVNNEKTVFDAWGGGTATVGKFSIDFTTLASDSVVQYNGTGTVQSITGGDVGTFTITIGDREFVITGDDMVNQNGGGLEAAASGGTTKSTIKGTQLANALMYVLRGRNDSNDAYATINGVKWKVSNGNGKLTFAQVEAPRTASQAVTDFNVKLDYKKSSTSKWDFSFANGKKLQDGTQTEQKAVWQGATRGAETVFELKTEDIVDGAVLTLGTKVIKFYVGKDSKATKGSATVEINLKHMEAGDKDLLRVALSAIGSAVKSATLKGQYVNSAGVTQTATFAFTVSVTDKGIAVMRNVAPTSGSASQVVFTSLEKLAGNFSMSYFAQHPAVEAKHGLMLQIGDTSESYNQLEVSIADCHVAAIGIGSISIADQSSAQAAVSVIKDAINYISDVRGTLGATQNRLDHTINNLSVMTENIQDAESTIRDTDIAEEMMAYTKNNILIQSAQAMLAQANQVPQGVLQLLQ